MTKPRTAKVPASEPANDRETPEISNALVDHPLLGEGNIHTIWVYRVFRNKHGKEETIPKLMEGDPKELQVESQILAQWGPGKYRVIGRDRNHKLCGSQRIFRFEDETGRVPEELEEPPITGASGASSGPAIGGPAAELLAINASLRESLKTLEQRFVTELANAEKRRETDLSTIGGLNTELIKVFGGRQHTEGGGEFEKFLRHRNEQLERRVETLEKELREAREGLQEKSWKLEHRQKSDTYETKLAEEGLPRVFGLIDRFLEKKEGGGQVFRLPTLGELQTRLASRAEMPLEEIKAFLEFRAKGMVPADILPIVEELGFQTGLLERPSAV